MNNVYTKCAQIKKKCTQNVHFFINKQTELNCFLSILYVVCFGFAKAYLTEPHWIRTRFPCFLISDNATK